MKSKHQYRITVNESIGPIQDVSPCEQWARAAEVIEGRGGKATLHRRILTGLSILPLLTDATRYITLGELVIGPWEIWAEVESR
jgi:hypothetical protein